MGYDFLAVKTALEKKGYRVSVFERKEEAASYVNGRINGRTVGFGGSVTLREMGLFELLSPHNEVIWHDRLPVGMSVAQARTAASRAEVYLSSVNGLSEKGEIVNIDNTGNRVAAVSYGPQEVWLFVGCNKLAGTLEEAIFRARNVAGPKNAQRLGRKTPCALRGDRCYDCDSPERICRNLSVFLEKPTGASYEVILIGEPLGY